MEKITIRPGFLVTSEPIDDVDGFNMTDEISDLTEELYEGVLARKKNVIHKLKKAITRYPHIPQFKNYLVAYYMSAGIETNAWSVNRKLVEKHPDYLFGKINLAREYLIKNELELIPGVLGEDLDLKALYPQRDVFHVSEVRDYCCVVIDYLCAIGDVASAKEKLKIMQAADKDSELTERAEFVIEQAEYDFRISKLIKSDYEPFTVQTKKQAETQKTEKPVFENPDIEEIYDWDLFVEKEDYNKILNLERTSLIRDLELLLKDSYERYSYFEMSREGDLDDPYIGMYNFATHALVLLGELEAKESSDTVLEMLSQSGEYFEFYFGDLLFEDCNVPFYKLVNDQLDKCFDFMLKPNISTEARNVLSGVVSQVVLQEPERKAEVFDWFKRLFEAYAEISDDLHIIDSEHVGMLVSCAVDIQAAELLPQIKTLFEQGKVWEGISGTYQSVAEDIQSEGCKAKPLELLSIDEIYEVFEEYEYGYTDEDDFEDYDEVPETNNNSESYFPETPIIPLKTEPKVGRNDPCPCGSGKKYKKCCMNKPDQD